MRALGRVGHAQLELTLLRACADVCRLTHLLRAVRTDVVNDALAEYDLLLRGALDSLLATSLSDEQWSEATLPVRYGGPGMKCISHVRTAYRVSACASFVSKNALAKPLISLSAKQS